VHDPVIMLAVYTLPHDSRECIWKRMSKSLCIWLQERIGRAKVVGLCLTAWNQLVHHGPWSQLSTWQARVVIWSTNLSRNRSCKKWSSSTTPKSMGRFPPAGRSNMLDVAQVLGAVGGHWLQVPCMLLHCLLVLKSTMVTVATKWMGSLT